VALFRRQQFRNQQNAARAGDVRGVLMNTPIEQLRPQMRLMITRPGPNLDPRSMLWPLGDRGEIVAVACIKGPDSTAVTIETPMVQHWGMAAEDVWLQAATNLAYEGLDGTPFETSTGSTIHSLLGKGWPGSSQLFRLGQALNPPLPGGALVALPTDNCLLALPINSQRTAGMAGYVMEVSRSLTRDQQPLSTGMFWWHEGILEELEIIWQTPDRPQFAGSSRFSQVMFALPAQ
jgi:hypothetical protein